MANASLAAFKRTVTVDWPKQQQADARGVLLKAASDGHARIVSDAKARSGFAPDFDSYANTPSNTNLSSVKLPGPIVYRYRYQREIIDAGLRLLRAASPVQSGRYRDSHLVFLNGTRIDPGSIPVIREGDEIMIVNTVPYARRIEVGKTESGRDFVLQVPNRIYDRIGKELKAKYRNLASIDVQFVDISAAYTLKRNAVGRGRSRVSKSRRAGAAITYPAIVIRPL